MSPQEDSVVDFENPPTTEEENGVRTVAKASRYQVFEIDKGLRFRHTELLVPLNLLLATTGEIALTEDGAEENFILHVWIGCDRSRPSLHPQGGDCGQVSEHSKLSDVLLSGWRRRWFQDGHLHGV